MGFSPPIPPHPPNPTNSTDSAAVIPTKVGIQTCRHRNLSDKTVSLNFTS
ncbi:hypothetical protein NEIPOLOT_02595 [Neisseria polysaccharea ATCC 43768]|nr:hypothetical protein NEIPOLOT_02595 [Neisseria polysaccharea ATCC 43768]